MGQGLSQWSPSPPCIRIRRIACEMCRLPKATGVHLNEPPPSLRTPGRTNGVGRIAEWGSEEWWACWEFLAGCGRALDTLTVGGALKQGADSKNAAFWIAGDEWAQDCPWAPHFLGRGEECIHTSV